MDNVISACGVVCSDCGAFLASQKGPAYQQEVAEAWHRIYGFKAEPATLTCAGCLSSDDQVFPSSVKCAARQCCRTKGLSNCAECPEKTCQLLEKAQSNWESVPALEAKLSASDWQRYAQPYCGYRERLESLRRDFCR